MEEQQCKEFGQLLPIGAFQSVQLVEAAQIDSLIAAALAKTETDPSCADRHLAEMIMSDCGNSTNHTRLLERITNRIAAHVATQTADALAEKHAQEDVPFLNGSEMQIADRLKERIRQLNNSWNAKWNRSTEEFDLCSKSEDKLRYQHAEIARLTAENEALRKNPAPLTDVEKHAMWVMATIDQCSHEQCYLRGIADSESVHGIGEKP